MEFREARSLALLAKLHSIAKTADAMNLTPAAVHKQIKNIEREFGIVLYETSGKAVRMTEAARILVPYLEEMLAQHRAMEAAVNEWKGLRRGFVRVGCNPAAGSFLLPPLFRRFRKNWPRITLSLEVGANPEVMEAVANRSLDCALAHWTDRMDERLVEDARWEYDIVMVTCMKEPPARAPLSALSEFPLVQLPVGNYLGDRIHEYIASHGLTPAECLIVSNTETMIAMVQAGLGLAMLPLWAADADVRSGRLRIIEQEEPRLTTGVSLVRTRGGYTPPATQAFLEVAAAYRWKHLRRLPA
jgi:LysR family nitrogen assimilation transcriptional regulator